MKLGMSYYLLSPGTMDPWALVPEAFELAKASWLCPGCLSPRREVTKVDAVVEEVPNDVALNCLHVCGVGIARKDFLQALGSQDASRDLRLGQVSLADQTPLERWSTFIGAHSIIVRGSEHVTSRDCPDCGRKLYFAMGKRYLCPRPDPRISIFDCGLGQIVITEKLMGRIALNKWDKLDCTSLPVLDEPLDGLGILDVT